MSKQTIKKSFINDFEKRTEKRERVSNRVSNRLSEISNSNPGVMEKMSTGDRLKILRLIRNEAEAIESVKETLPHFGLVTFK